MEEQKLWHAMTAPDALHASEASIQGLTDTEAKKRRAAHPGSAFPRPKATSVGKIAMRQVASPLTLILLFAMALSVAYGEVIEAWLTGGVIAVNAALGFFQEYKADRALAALQKFLPLQARVLRDGEIVAINADDIVVGDIVEFSAGDKVVADARLIAATQLATGESALTGESSEVVKNIELIDASASVSDRKNMIYAGTTVVSGYGRAVVIAVGKQTEFGRISTLVTQTAAEPTPLERDMKRFARQLSGIMIIVAGGLFLFGLYRGMSVPDMAAVSAAVAVAAVPEGLLVSMTVILAVGTRRMVKRNALVRKLVAAETLGGVNVMCIDKTGTITTGDMEVVEVRSGVRLLAISGKMEIETVLKRALWALGGSEQESGGGNQTERTLRVFVQKNITTKESDEWSVIESLPFNSKEKFAAKVISKGADRETIILGAPDVLLERSGINDAERSMYAKVLDDMTARGLRVLLIARKEGGATDGDILTDSKPIGFIGLQDPIRPHIADVVRQAKSAGVRTIMITGDHPQTAYLVAHSVGITTDREQVVTGTQLHAMDDGQLAQRIRDIRVFARVLPEDKVRIVRALQAQGGVVAMTGDGVNDGPALKAADVGVAMGSGTDVAKETSELVLLDNNARSIVDAIREGRVIFENLRKVLAYLLTFSMSETAILAAALAVGLPLPFSPLHILWINVVTDGFPGVALAFERGERGIMGEAPRGNNAPLMDRRMWTFVVLCGLVAMTGLIGTYAYAIGQGASLETARTLLFLSLGIDSLFAVFIMRSLRSGFWATSLASNGYLLAAVAVGFGLLLLPVTVPLMREAFELVVLPWTGWVFIFGLAGVKFALFELMKHLTVRRYFSQNASVVMMSP
jgi:Ca2+-transporting ATPase